MGTMELWLGPAGAGKTRRALDVLRAELDAHWWAVRYLVPTVGQKRSIEHLLLEHFPRAGMFGDPVNIFFTFAQEVAQRGGVRGNQLSELQKHLLLKELVQTTPLEYFARAAQFPGFVQALGEAIDELKVHMIMSEELLAAAEKAEERGAGDFARKVRELGTLYARYQQRVIEENLYDNEGIMWLAAECLRTKPDLFAGELRCLILDGFARLTPIQIHFLRALAPRAERTILLFDYEAARSMTYHPVHTSLEQLFKLEQTDQIAAREVWCAREDPPRTALEVLRSEVFRDRNTVCPLDDSVRLFVGATPAHETELIAREVRALLRAGKLPDGTKIQPADIAILARNGDRVRERFAHAFQRYGLTIRRDPPLLAHTSVGRALLAAFRLVRDRWKREDVLLLLKSGFLDIDPAVAYRIDLTARTQYLRDRRQTWFELWPDEATRETLAQALAPLAAFDAAYHRYGDEQAPFLDAVGSLLQAFQQQALPDIPPLPDEDEGAAGRFVALRAAFTRGAAILDDLRQLRGLSSAYRNEELLDVITTALLRESVPDNAASDDGIPVLSVHTTGGQKFKVVFLCDLLQGSFPRHQRESAFLMDHEREETLRDLQVLIETRKHLEDDEQYWFLHALSAATHRLIMSCPENDLDGRPLERSIFLEEVGKVLPDLAQHAVTTSFRDVVPSLAHAESREEFLASLAYQMRTERSPQQRVELVAAYVGCSHVDGHAGLLARAFRRAQGQQAALITAEVLGNLAARQQPFSATELQGYLDCPFSWFAGHCLAVRSVVEEFSPLDRGAILHGVLERLYRRRQQHPGEPVHLEGETVDALWPEVERDLRAKLEGEPRFMNRANFLKDIEWEHLCRMMRRFLRHEIERAQTRGAHPAYFEFRFGDTPHNALLLDHGSIRLRGTLDRIDLVDEHPMQAIVIDYKSSAGMSLKDLRAGKIVQAPIYLLAVQRLFNMEPLGAEFIGLKQGDSRGIYLQGIKALYNASRGLEEFAPGEWETFLAVCEASLCDGAHAMGRGEIPLAPTITRCSENCEYFALCRGDRFTLAQLLRRKSDEAISVDPSSSPPV